MWNKLLGNLDEGLLFIVSAPAGTGKTTLVKMLVDEFPSLVTSVSYTTRPCRPGEIPGVHYHFISEEEFKQKIEKNEFLEYAEIYGCYYGTSLKQVRDKQKEKKHVILVIDVQGALQIKGKIPSIFIFIKPPSLTVLKQRLTQRQTETSTVIAKRMEWAKKELEAVKEYDYCIVNEDLGTAYQVLRSIFIAEEHKIRHNTAQP